MSEVIIMDKPLIMVSSVTYAMRGRDILSQYGIKSSIERTPKNSLVKGCGYSLFVPNDTDRAEEILKNSGVRVIGRTEGSKKL